MRAWFESLQAREQRLLVIGGGVVVLTLLWLFVWDPVAVGSARAEADIERKQQLLERARRTLTAAAPAAPAQGSAGGACAQSLTLLVANTVRDAGLGNAYRSSSPFGADGLRVSLENASFDLTVTWLGRLQAECGI